MKTLIASAVFLATMGSPSVAKAEYRPVTSKAEFLSLMGQRNLSNRLYGINLKVSSDGQIVGTGAGWEVTGSWDWQDGYFCREMNWGGDPIPYNCQLVEIRNGNEMRFTVDQGAGDSASFMLR